MKELILKVESNHKTYQIVGYDVGEDSERYKAYRDDRLLGTYAENVGGLLTATRVLNEQILEDQYDRKDPEPDGEEIFVNFYRCEDCDHDWKDTWSCACDDRCPKCGSSVSPHHFDYYP